MGDDAMKRKHNAAVWLVDRHVDEGLGSRVAVISDGVETTYAELQTQLFRQQNALADLEVAAGDRVAMVMNDDLSFMAIFLGALRSGVVPVPLSTMLSGAELGPIIADSGAVALFISDTYVDAIAEISETANDLRAVVVSGDAGDAAATRGGVQVAQWSTFVDQDPQPGADTAVDSPAFWLYSSGTTGVPKGVMHVHGSMRATAETYGEQVLRITEHDRFLSIAKLFFAYGLGNSLTFPLSVGGTAILYAQAPTPAAFADLIQTEMPTLFFASPGFAAAMLDSDPAPEVFASVRACVTAGESLPANVCERFAALIDAPVLDGIGSTELLHIFLSNTLTSQTPGTSGRPVPGYSAELRSEEGEVVTEPDVPAYLYVRGPSAAVGYHERPEASVAAFVDGWVRTGDVYTCSADGEWTFLGRNNDMIKAGGIWVSPAEVESTLIEHADVLEVAVVGTRNATGLEEVVAFVVPAAGTSPKPEELEVHCREHMASFKRPRQIHIVESLPKTATGKIKRFALRETLSGGL